MDVYISRNVDMVYFVGKSSAVRVSVNDYLLLNEEETILYKCIKNNSDVDIFLYEYASKIKYDESINSLKDVILNYILNTKSGKILYTTNEKNSRKDLIRNVGNYNMFFPRYLQIELTKRCNLYCPHCYKSANDNDAADIDVLELKKIIDFIGENRVEKVGFTGGEPLLHPQFIDIVKYIQKITHADIELNTNGLLVGELPMEFLKKFRAISISMYGKDRDEFLKKTGSLNGFDKFVESCKKLSENGVRFNLSLIMTKDRLNHMEEYVLLAIELGASSMSFGTTGREGRGADFPNDSDWFLTDEDTKAMYREMRKIVSKYSDKIFIDEWIRGIYKKDDTGMTRLYPEGVLSCGAGATDWALSEKLLFRPCVSMPEVFPLQFTFEEWQRYVLGYEKIDWKERLTIFRENWRKSSNGLAEYCMRIDGLLDHKAIPR